MALESVHFDESPRTPQSEPPAGHQNIADALRDFCQESGLDATSELYNRAVELCRDYEFAKAQQQLVLLLSLDPSDGQAHLLLAKVQTGLKHFAEALRSLELSVQYGQNPPEDLRRRIEEHLSAERTGQTERLTTMTAREEGEIQALRQEARRLRSENARLVGKAHDLGREVRRWAWGTTGVASFAALFIVGNLLLGGGSSATAEALPTDAATQTAAAQAAPVTGDGTATAAGQAGAAATEGAAASPPPATALAQEIQRALNEAAGLDGTALEISTQTGKVTAKGTVETARQRRHAREIIEGIGGVVDVDTSDLQILARTKGTSHTVVSGDNLSAISLHYYGEAMLADKILRANSKLLGGKPNLAVGMKLTIPAVD